MNAWSTRIRGRGFIQIGLDATNGVVAHCSGLENFSLSNSAIMHSRTSMHIDGGGLEIGAAFATAANVIGPSRFRLIIAAA